MTISVFHYLDTNIKNSTELVLRDGEVTMTEQEVYNISSSSFAELIAWRPS